MKIITKGLAWLERYAYNSKLNEEVNLWWRKLGLNKRKEIYEREK